ncbi:hypothetical protein RRG08_020711 [Elysia crispata]|uniref:Uncharacterized protein n=1 Tax=Elysia crispata TaxID=231223 RepID=A0AAE1B132_9GAST|nr:hypothetical protein RRG08_020711 [Elysia crispata]
MFGLQTPLVKSEQACEFDTVQTILSHRLYPSPVNFSPSVTKDDRRGVQWPLVLCCLPNLMARTVHPGTQNTRKSSPAKDWFAICELFTSTFCELAMNEPFTVQLFIVENPDLVPGHVPVWNLAPIYFA